MSRLDKKMRAVTINSFINLSKTKTAKQTGMLYGSQILVMFLGLITAPIITRALGPEKYGILAFILAIIAFISLFFEFGFFAAGARLLASSKDKKKDQELIGALTFITISFALSFSLTLFIFSFFIDSIFKTFVGDILRFVSILAAIFPFQYMLLQICQGTNEIGKMAIANITTKLWYLVGLLIAVKFFGLSVLITLVLNLTGVIIAVVLVIWSLKPKFGNLKENLGLIWKETKEYGFHVYCGRVVDVSTYQLDSIFISYFVSTTAVGSYTLAMIIASPMALLSRALSTSLFKGFVDKEKIPKKVILLNFTWLLACVIGLGLSGKFIVVLLFSDKYLATIPLILPLAIAGFFQGMYQPYNMFLAAKGKGCWMRNMAWMMAAGNFLCNIIFIPPWGVMGAAIASAVSMGFAISVYLFYYRKYLKELELI